MPAQPRWLAHLPRIRATLEASEVPFLDRPAIERLFGVRARQANYLMQTLGGYKVGIASVVSRDDLLGKLEALSGRRGYAAETERKARVLEALEAGRQGRERVSAPLPRPSGTSLPPGVRLLRPGELTLVFSTPEDLLGRVMALAQSATADYAAFAAALAIEHEK